MIPFKEKNRGRNRAPLFAGALLLFLISAAGCVSVESDPKGEHDSSFDYALVNFHYKMAEKFWNQGKEDLAVKYLHKAVVGDPTALEPRLGLIDIHVARGSVDEALTTIDSFPEEMKYDSEVLDRLLYILELKGDDEAAARVIAEAQDREVPTARFLKTRAEARVFRNDFATALKFYERARRDFPQDTALLEAMSALYGLMGREAQRAEILVDLIALLPERTDFPIEAARAFEKAGRPKEGIVQLESLILGEGRMVRGDVCQGLGYLYIREERWQHACEIYERARVRGDAVLTLEERKSLAETYLRNGENVKAAAELQDLVLRQPEDPVTRAALALAYWRMGHVERAEEIVKGAGAGTKEGTVLGAVENKIRGGKSVD